jgi:hypothetical protein
MLWVAHGQPIRIAKMVYGSLDDDEHEALSILKLLEQTKAIAHPSIRK